MLMNVSKNDVRLFYDFYFVIKVVTGLNFINKAYGEIIRTDYNLKIS